MEKNILVVGGGVRSGAGGGVRFGAGRQAEEST